MLCAINRRQCDRSSSHDKACFDGSQDINGKSVSQMLDEPLSAYWLYGIDPLHDLNRGKSYCDLLKDRLWWRYVMIRHHLDRLPM